MNEQKTNFFFLHVINISRGKKKHLATCSLYTWQNMDTCKIHTSNWTRVNTRVHLDTCKYTRPFGHV
jgi:hypothetical protein